MGRQGRKSKKAADLEKAEAIEAEAAALRARFAEVLRDNLSPEGVVAIAESIIDRDAIKSADVRREVEWFRDFLAEMVGGEYPIIVKKLGL